MAIRPSARGPQSIAQDQRSTARMTEQSAPRAAPTPMPPHGPIDAPSPAPDVTTEDSVARRQALRATPKAVSGKNRPAVRRPDEKEQTPTTERSAVTAKARATHDLPARLARGGGTPPAAAARQAGMVFRRMERGRSSRSDTAPQPPRVMVQPSATPAVPAAEPATPALTAAPLTQEAGPAHHPRKGQAHGERTPASVLRRAAPAAVPPAKSIGEARTAGRDEAVATDSLATLQPTPSQAIWPSPAPQLPPSKPEIRVEIGRVTLESPPVPAPRRRATATGFDTFAEARHNGRWPMEGG
ncbi:MAG: hypothetical protein V4510_10570 [bacterium]